MENSSSSTSGSTATVAAEVWMRPPDSVTGTRWTLWPPASYFRRDQAPAPSTTKLISLMPPSSVMLELAISIFQPFESAYMEYMRKRSRAKSMPSSPPTPPRISIITFLPSLGSLGSKRTRSDCPSASRRLPASSYSSRASAFNSASPIISRAASMSALHCAYFLYSVTTGSSSPISLAHLAYASASE